MQPLRGNWLALLYVLLVASHLWAAPTPPKEPGLISEGSFGKVYEAGPGIAKKVQRFNLPEHNVAIVQDVFLAQERGLCFRAIETDGGIALVSFMKRYPGALYGEPFPSAAKIKLYFRSLIEQVLSLHEADIIHGDLKPSNVLVDGTWFGDPCTLCDFGSALHTTIARERIVASEYLCTYSYRAPEALPVAFSEDGSLRGLPLSTPRPLTTASDAFALGAILAEIFLKGHRLFSGSDECEFELAVMHDNMHNMLNERPLKDPRDLALFSPKVFSQLEHMNLKGKIVIAKAKLFGAFNLLKGLLELDPARRMTLEQALADPFLASCTSYKPRGAVLSPEDRLARCAALSERYLALQRRLQGDYNLIEECDALTAFTPPPEPPAAVRPAEPAQVGGPCLGEGGCCSVM